MTEVTNELIYEVLKQLQADLAVVKTVQTDHGRQFLDLRKQMNAHQSQLTESRKIL